MSVTSKRFVRNYTWTDLHPDDTAARVQLREELWAWRRASGMTEKELSRAAGLNPGWARGVFGKTSWRLSTVQHLARVLGARFILLAQVADLGVPRAASHVTTLRVMFPEGTANRDEADRIVLGDFGRRLRETLEVSAPELGHLLKMKPGNVRDWENGVYPDYLLLTAQRYFRALGRPLSFTLWPQEAEPYSAPSTWKVIP